MALCLITGTNTYSYHHHRHQCHHHHCICCPLCVTFVHLICNYRLWQSNYKFCRRLLLETEICGKVHLTSPVAFLGCCWRCPLSGLEVLNCCAVSSAPHRLLEVPSIGFGSFELLCSVFGTTPAVDTTVNCRNLLGNIPFLFID